MANNTTLTPGALPGDGLVVTDSPTFYDRFNQLPAMLWKHQDLLVLQGRLVFVAMACIWLGSFAALRRPPSAEPAPKWKKKASTGAEDEEDDDDEDDEENVVQGLAPSDVILMPIVAGITLVGLYYIIQWLKDPYILNKILRVQYSLMSLASMGKFLADGLDFITAFVFPDVWKAPDGALYHFDAMKKRQYQLKIDGERIYDDKKTSPFPGSRFLGIALSERRHLILWDVRHLLKQHWTIKLAIHGITKQRFRVKFGAVLGMLLSILASVLYQTTNSTFLSNIMGYSFSYLGLITLSPTDFSIAGGLLFGLFFYDIYMVFYTPYMVTVATKLDVPIKLVFQSETRSSMLGLGDIVVPGIFIGMCLRFDHYMYYLRQQKLVSVELKTITSESSDQSSSVDVTETSESARMVQKPTYINPQGQWGNRFWSSSAFLGDIFSSQATPAVKASAFPKPYFGAAMLGYFLGMLVTLLVLFVYRHGQPALLYLVPGVVGATLLTALVRGDVSEMWKFTEDGSLDKKDIVVEVDEAGNVIREISSDKKDKKEENTEKKEAEETKKTDASQETLVSGTEAAVTESKENRKPASSRKVFEFTIEAPASLVEQIG